MTPLLRTFSIRMQHENKPPALTVFCWTERVGSRNHSTRTSFREMIGLNRVSWCHANWDFRRAVESIELLNLITYSILTFLQILDKGEETFIPKRRIFNIDPTLHNYSTLNWVSLQRWGIIEVICRMGSSWNTFLAKHSGKKVGISWTKVIFWKWWKIKDFDP